MHYRTFSSIPGLYKLDANSLQLYQAKLLLDFAKCSPSSEKLTNANSLYICICLYVAGCVCTFSTIHSVKYFETVSVDRYKNRTMKYY